MPAALRRAFSQSGEGATRTPCRTRAVNRAHSAGSSIATCTSSPVGRSPVAGGSCSSSARRRRSKTAATSRATPRTDSRSERFARISKSSTTSDSATRAASGSPGAKPAPSFMMPSCSSEISSSRSERIIPSDSDPRSFARSSFRPSGMRSPGSATATVSPAPKFQAPQTIWRGSGPPGVDLAELQPVGVRVRVRLQHEAGEHEPLDPVLLGQPATGDLLDLDARERDPRAELGERRQRIVQVGLQPADRHLHRRPPANCSRNRRSSS